MPSVTQENTMANHAALIVAAALTLPAVAQSPEIKKVPARYTSPASGSEMYHSYCASCHGTKGLGDGPVAPHLKTAIPDLTTLARQNQGVYPAQRVAQVIRGDVGVTSHGVREMAVWGPFFLSMNNSQEPVVRIRVNNLTSYIETMQVK
jgi:mono/diheme cytochrome c family protein